MNPTGVRTPLGYKSSKNQLNPSQSPLASHVTSHQSRVTPLSRSNFKIPKQTNTELHQLLHHVSFINGFVETDSNQLSGKQGVQEDSDSHISSLNCVLGMERNVREVDTVQQSSKQGEQEDSDSDIDSFYRVQSNVTEVETLQQSSKQEEQEDSDSEMFAFYRVLGMESNVTEVDTVQQSGKKEEHVADVSNAGITADSDLSSIYRVLETESNVTEVARRSKAVQTRNLLLVFQMLGC